MVLPPASKPLPAVILLLSLATQSCSAAMAAWWTTIGPQVIRQNLTTGAIMYSNCNSTDTPVFPVDPPNLFSLSYEPRNGTAITGKGWWNEKTTYASIFYQNTNGDLVNSFHMCNWQTGKFSRTADVIISSDSPSVHSSTGLGSVLLSDKDGYRVFYHDANKSVNAIGYKPSDQSWYYAGVVSRDVPSGMAIGAQFSQARNISVVFPKDSENIEVARYNSDGRYWLSSLPRPLAGNLTSNTNSTNTTDIQLDTQASTNFTLDSWTGNPTAIATSVDKAFTRSIFWIGTDRALRQISNINYSWRPMNNQSAEVWPLADDPNADFALASDFSSSIVRIYYDVNKTLTEVKFDKDGLWKTAAALPLVSPPSSNTTNDAGSGTSATPAASETAPGTSDAASSELSAGAKAGIGVGVAVGAIAILGAVLGVCLMRRKKAAQAAAEAAAAAEEEEEEKQRQAAYAAQQQQLQQNQQYHHQYYGGGGAGSDAGATYPASYGSSPPPPLTPFSDGGYGSWDKKSAAGGHGASPPPPQELNGVVPTYELAEQRYTHELPEQRQVPEMDAGGGHGETGTAPSAGLPHGQRHQ